MQPVQIHARSGHLHPTVDPAAMEAAKAEEAFLQEKGEGKTKDRRKHMTDIDPVVTTPMGMATATVETTTRDEQGDDPQYRDSTYPVTRRCLQAIGGEREKR